MNDPKVSLPREENSIKRNEDLPSSRASLNVWFIGLFLFCTSSWNVHVSDALKFKVKLSSFQLLTNLLKCLFFFVVLGGFWAFLSETSAVQAGCPSLCSCEREDRDWSGRFSALLQRRNLSGWKGIMKSVCYFLAGDGTLLKNNLMDVPLKSWYDIDRMCSNEKGFSSIVV